MTTQTPRPKPARLTREQADTLNRECGKRSFEPGMKVGFAKLAFAGIVDSLERADSVFTDLTQAVE